MGLFDFFKGNKEDENQNPQVNLTAPVDGEVIKIDQVNDPVFSQKMMGDGYAVQPTSREIYAPAHGEVVSVFPTKHAVGLELANGVEVLIHIGIDTVELEGGPFETLIKEGDEVEPDTLIATVDLDSLDRAGKDNTVIVVFTNMDQVSDFELTTTGSVTHGQNIGNVTGV